MTATFKNKLTLCSRCVKIFFPLFCLEIGPSVETPQKPDFYRLSGNWAIGRNWMPRRKDLKSQQNV